MSFHNLKILPLLAILAIPAVADEDNSDEVLADQESKRCISVRSVRSTRVIDDNTVLFYMRGKDIYLNSLRTNCTRLSREGRFSYTVHASSLCELDRIRILMDTGFGLQEGRSCALGRFQPVTREDV